MFGELIRGPKCSSLPLSKPTSCPRSGEMWDISGQALDFRVIILVLTTWPAHLRIYSRHRGRDKNVWRIDPWSEMLDGPHLPTSAGAISLSRAIIVSIPTAGSVSVSQAVLASAREEVQRDSNSKATLWMSNKAEPVSKGK
jgi:hypothetical protein